MNSIIKNLYIIECPDLEAEAEADPALFLAYLIAP
jgi:hypothetical protein